MRPGSHIYRTDHTVIPCDSTRISRQPDWDGLRAQLAFRIRLAGPGIRSPFSILGSTTTRAHIGIDRKEKKKHSNE